MTQDYLSPEKYKELEAELHYLQNEGRTEVASRLEYAKSLGDLSENAEYTEAREAFGNLEERIASLEFILKNATIVKQHHSVRIELGSRILAIREGAKEGKRYTIVGSRDSNVMENKISNESPMGVAMLGKKKGDSFTVKTPKGDTNYTITDIE